jgi:hypothetical protein
MKTTTKTALVLSLGLAALSSMAGEIKDVTISAEGARNETGYIWNEAYQNLGSAHGGNARIHGGAINANNVRNTAKGHGGVATQNIGFAKDAGLLKNTTVVATGATNSTTADRAKATQEIGVAIQNGQVVDSMVYAPGARNEAQGKDSTATQEIGKASGNGRITGSSVVAARATNIATWNETVATQQIGVASGNGRIQGTTVYANDAANIAGGGWGSKAEQRIGVAR